MRNGTTRPSSYVFAALKMTLIGSAHTKLVLAVLADMADEKGQCWPSHQFLADRCCCGISTVKRSVDEIKELGLFQVENRGKGKWKTSNLYTILDSPHWAIDSPRWADPQSTVDPPPQSTVGYENNTLSKTPLKMQKTRDRSLDDDLGDTSWAEGLVAKENRSGE